MILEEIWELFGKSSMKRDKFSTFHPAIHFVYFVFVLGFSMFLMHPVLLLISCIGGMAYYVYLKHWKALKTACWLMLPAFFLSTMINPLFNHQGVTLIFYFRNGNPLTLESILYGLAAGVMLVSVLNWFSCYQVVMTSDKFIYLFGKAIPAMSLIFSMVLRFVPAFQNQILKISNAQKGIGRDAANGTIFQRIGHGIKILSVMTTWALENSVETADSMKSRGYGLRGRTNFSIYRFDSRDQRLLVLVVLLGGNVFWGIVTKKIQFLYYPMLVMNQNDFGAIWTYSCYGILCLLPLLINMKEDLTWRYLKSKI